MYIIHIQANNLMKRVSKGINKSINNPNFMLMYYKQKYINVLFIGTIGITYLISTPTIYSYARVPCITEIF